MHNKLKILILLFNKKQLNISITGSRNIINTTYIKNLIEKNLKSFFKFDNVLISGGANGIDKLCEKYVSNLCKTIFIIQPNYNKYGKGAPFIRNKEIVEISDLIIAFWNGYSKGTKHVIDTAIKLNKPIIINYF